MNAAKQQLIQSWLNKASHDLNAARILAASEEAVLDTAIYHCQQAAEKAVKAFLAFCDHDILKTHDIGLLLETAREYVPEFEACLEAAELLTPYSTLYRYPGVVNEPSRVEFNEALQAAEQLYSFVLSRLPACFSTKN